MSLLVQNYLRAGSSLEKLAEEYSISNRPHGLYPNLFLLKYNQQKSNFSQEIVRECRGLILDRDQDWNVVSFLYKKFFNKGEVLAAEIDWSNARVYAKEDGTLIGLYYYDSKWHAQTSGTPDAMGNVNTSATTFKELFWQVWEKLDYKLPLDTRKCYAFELCTPYNHVVVDYKVSRIVLHGARTIDDALGHPEHTPEEIAAEYGWECIRSFPLQSVEQVAAVVEILPPFEQEGYVIASRNADGTFGRIKWKSLEYLRFAHMRDGAGPRKILELICAGESDEFLSYFPEFSKLHADIKAKYNGLIVDLTTFYNEIKDIPVQKDFALRAVKHGMSGALFSYRSGKVKSFEEFVANLAKLHIRTLIEYLKIRDIVFEV